MEAQRGAPAEAKVLHCTPPSRAPRAPKVPCLGRPGTCSGAACSGAASSPYSRMRDYGDTAKDSQCTCLLRAIPDILSCMVGNAKWEGMMPTKVSLIVACGTYIRKMEASPQPWQAPKKSRRYTRCASSMRTTRRETSQEPQPWTSR